MAEDRYTLDEARILLADLECQRVGHDLVQSRRTGYQFTGQGKGFEIRCGRCRTVFREVK